MITFHRKIPSQMTDKLVVEILRFDLIKAEKIKRWRLNFNTKGHISPGADGNIYESPKIGNCEIN